MVSKVPTSPALALFALAALLALLVAGCGGGSSSSAGSSTSAAAPSKGSSSSPGSKAGASTAAEEEPETAPAIPLEPGYADWPYFGRVPQRTHYLPANRGVVDRPLDPPLRQAWSINTHALIEFPPAIGGGVAYAINKYGNGKAIELGTRKIVGELSLDPKNKGHQEIVTGPAYYRGDVYGAFLDGTLAAGNGKTGKTVWERHLHAHLESSPLPVDGNLYLGTDTAEVLALDAGDGHTVWTFKAPGAIKASPSYDAGKVFVADYESSMYALEANTGKPVWRTNTSKVAPYGSGGFFSSPAIAFGDVYAARDDGVVYAFDEGTGKVRWTFQTGADVYGSPAVAQVPGTPPTVYIGAENGTFYALNARTGKVEWTYDVGGPVPGTATVIGHTVYVSSFETKKTVGIDVRTHKVDYTLDQAGYTPMVSDGRRLIAVGYFTVLGLEPTKP
ncbi:MAG TPA: PQQ-binding-like beta-propeller repeat protein [Solirubrobacterales bacterium]|nr:PQQ-binding-like beta-propeller repeat protein [Solirubrobacterales bacterium]